MALTLAHDASWAKSLSEAIFWARKSLPEMQRPALACEGEHSSCVSTKSVEIVVRADLIVSASSIAYLAHLSAELVAKLRGIWFEQL